MKAKKLIAMVLTLAVLATTVCFSGLSAFAAEITEETAQAANAQAAAAQAIDQQYAYSGDDLGATYSPESTTFKVWSPTATAISLNLYKTGSDEEEGAGKISTTELTKVMDGGDWTGVWSVTVDGDLKNVYYTYTITTTTTTTIGSEETTTKETQDVYSKATGVNGARSMVVDMADTNPEGWENDQHIFLDKSTDASIWEIQVKDFSYNENSGVSEANRGKFLGFTETGTTLNNEGKIATGIDYLKELGITTVHINPFYDFGSIDETGDDSQFNWGYDPVNYNVPEGSFSTNPYDGNVRIKECKQMVKALHDAGIQVVMDVVYNHTYSADSCFQATVPDYYYRFTSAGAFSNGSGCGNETATERAMFRNYVAQSCAYWVNEYHIDGFRFDLMGCMDVETMNVIRAVLDEIDPKVLMYGEGWSGGTCTFDPTTCDGTTTYAATQSNIKKMDDRIALFNDKIRDSIKGSVFEAAGQGFIQGSASSAKGISYGVRANTVGNNGWQPNVPSQCVSYASAHDNATLYDRLINSTGKSKSDGYRTRYNDLVEMNKLAAAIEMTSQGIHFMLAGEEMARSKDGDENSYSSPATLNMLDWSNLVTYGDVVSYYKGLLQIRKAFAPFTDDTGAFKDNYTFNSSLTASTNTIAYTISNPTEGQWSKMACIYNGALQEKQVTLKDTSVQEWVILANDKTAGVTSLGEVSGSTFTLPASSAIIAVDKESFESAGITSNTSKVTVNSVYEKTGELLSSRVLMGTIGTNYVAEPDASIDFKYEINRIEGNAEGTYTEEEQTVTYYYEDYIPESIKNADFDENGVIDIRDVTELQLLIASTMEFTPEQIAKADLDYSGTVNINDATMLQLAIAEVSVASGSVEINYLDAETGEVLADATVLNGRVGTEYTAPAKSILAYTVDETKLPENATGVYTFGFKTVVNYYYNFSGTVQTLHVKFADGTPEKPLTLWAWQEKIPAEDGTFTSVNLTQAGAWPGDAIGTDKDENGWINVEVDTPGVGEFNFILSVSGTPQTQDYVGFTQEQSELWVIVDGDNMVNQGDWLDVYDVDPTANPDAKPLQ